MGLQSIGLGLFFFVCVVEMTGSSSQRRFIQTEENLLMTVTEEVQIEENIFDWKINETKTIVRLSGDRIIRLDEYKNRIHFFKQNLSLILKNVQLSDSGIYMAELNRLLGPEILAIYDVTVQAPVSPVTVSVDSVSNTSVSCNFTVSCSADDSTISISRSFTCDRLPCVEPRPLTPGHARAKPTSSLSLRLSKFSIICNNSNHVSWRSDTKNIQDVCPLFGSGVPSEKTNTGVIIAVVVVAAAVVLCLSIAAVVLRRRRKNQRIIMENTVYATAQEQSPRPAPDLLPDTIYSTVQPHSAPTPTPVPVQSPPESVYAKVNKPQNPAASLLSPSQPGLAD